MAKVRVTTHPGEILAEEYLKPAGLTNAALAAHIGVSTAALSRFINGKSNLSISLAYRLAKALGTSVEFWVELQTAYDLSSVKVDKDLAAAVRKIKKLDLAV